MTSGQRAQWRTALLAWVVARVLVVVGYLVAIVIAEEFIPDRARFLRTNPWSIWDGGWYVALAGNGYEAVDHEAIRFFPLFPMAARLLDPALPGGAVVPLVLLGNGAALVAGYLIQGLARSEGLDAATSERSAWVLALFPAAFTLVLPYSEPFFLVAALLACTASREGRWWATAAAGLAAGLSRPTGVLLALPMGMRALLPGRWGGDTARGGGSARRSGGSLLARCAAAVAPVAGLVLHLTYARHVTGDATEPIDAQGRYRGDFVDPVSRFGRAVSDLVGSERLGDGLHLPFLVMFVVLAAMSWRYLSRPAAAYATLLVAIALSAENLNSFERYALNAFPLLLVLAIAVRRPVLDRIWTLLSAGGLVGLTSLGWLSLYVP